MTLLGRTRRPRYNSLFLCSTLHETLVAPSSLESAYLLSPACFEHHCPVGLGNTSLSTTRKESENAKAFSSKVRGTTSLSIGRFRLPTNLGKCNCRSCGKVIDVDQRARYVGQPSLPCAKKIAKERRAIPSVDRSVVGPHFFTFTFNIYMSSGGS